MWTWLCSVRIGHHRRHRPAIHHHRSQDILRSQTRRSVLRQYRCLPAWPLFPICAPFSLTDIFCAHPLPAHPSYRVRVPSQSSDTSSSRPYETDRSEWSDGRGESVGREGTGQLDPLSTMACAVYHQSRTYEASAGRLFNEVTRRLTEMRYTN
jgi:hypothetical protein